MRPFSFMLALAYSLSVFVYWALLGRAVIALAYPRIGVLRAWLLAPAIGLSVLLLGLMAFNQAGIPIGRFTMPLTVVLGVAAAAVLARTRPTTAWLKTAPFAGSIVFALMWTGWPALETGFNWISYANDDMANYCLAAQRFIDHGFYAVPTMPELAGRDYASYYFFMHVSDMMRFGAEHIVAWGAALGHVKATQSFMPMIVALSLVQISAAGALVLHTGRGRKRALVTMWLLAASPLFMLGTLYQLIAQVGGVALLLATLVLLLRVWITPRRPVLVRYAILPALTSAALCIFYPEVTPFAGLAFCAYAALWTLRHRRLPVGLVALAAYSLLGAAVLLRHNLISYVSILVVQFNGAMHSANLLLSLFPYFMLPTGFSNLYGWMPIAHDFTEPVISGSIALGMVLTIAILARSVRDAWRLTPAAILLVIQFTFAVRLFTGGNDFGLYKLAMWMQPVLAAGFAGWVLWWSRGRTKVVVASLAIYAVTAAPSALYYTQASRGLKSGGLTELRLASQLGLGTHINGDPNAQLTSTIENVVAAKFAATELRGRPLALLSRDFFNPTTRTDYVKPTWAVRAQPHFEEMAEAIPLIDERNRTQLKSGVLWGTNFTQPVPERPTDFYVSVDPRLSLFNKFHLNPAPIARDGVFVAEPAGSIHNELLFVHSRLGNHYYLGDRRRISFFQQEPDLSAPGHSFNAIGRFMLLRIENPSPKVYLRVAATRTFLTGRTEWNPRAVVHAAEDHPLGAVGNGAFNLFIGPLTPQQFEGANYLAIDFAEFPRQLFDYRTGLKRLYNQRVLLDYRQLLAWGRDISAISEAEYKALRRPREVAHFPSDLALAHTLEFSGAYEDGWLSPHSKFVLAGSRAGELIRIRGVVPELKGSPLGTGNVEVSINGTRVCEVPARLGPFDLLLPIPRPARTTTVELKFTASTPLPGRDQRPTAAQLQFLRLLEPQTTINCDYNDAGGTRLAASGIDQDGWVAHDATLLLPGSTKASELVVQLEYPSWAETKGGNLNASIVGTDIKTDIALTPGQRPTLHLSLPASAAARTIRLSAPPEFSLPAPDSRHRSLRIVSVQLAPASKT